MKQRGRTSAAALAVVSPAGMLETKRPIPPEELTDEQAHEWRAVVNGLPADWFGRETYAMLAHYCRHVVSAKHVGELIEGYLTDPEFELEHYDRLLKMQEREGRALSALATRMRISQQSTYDKSTRKPKAVAAPWNSPKQG